MRWLPIGLVALAWATVGCDCDADDASPPAPGHEAQALPDTAVPYAQRVASLCDDGSPRHCWLLGALFLHGGGGLTTDTARARALFEWSCGQPGAFGCAEAGILASEEGGAEVATERWERGCRALRVRSCAELLKRQTRQAIPFEESTVLGCRAGSEFFCHAVGRAVADIDATPEGQPSEESLLPPRVDVMVKREAMRCDRRTGTMCTALAERYLADSPPAGMTRDVEHARRLAARACNDLNVTGCAVLGKLALEADPPDRETAEAMLARSCEGGSTKGCHYLADLLEPRDSAEEGRRRDLQLELCLTLEESEDCDRVRDLVGSTVGASAPSPASAP